MVLPNLNGFETIPMAKRDSSDEMTLGRQEDGTSKPDSFQIRPFPPILYPILSPPHQDEDATTADKSERNTSRLQHQQNLRLEHPSLTSPDRKPVEGGCAKRKGMAKRFSSLSSSGYFAVSWASRTDLPGHATPLRRVPVLQFCTATFWGGHILRVRRQMLGWEWCGGFTRFMVRREVGPCLVCSCSWRKIV